MSYFEFLIQSLSFFWSPYVYMIVLALAFAAASLGAAWSFSEGWYAWCVLWGVVAAVFLYLLFTTQIYFWQVGMDYLTWEHLS